MVVKTHPKFNNYEFDSETGKYRKIGSVEWLVGILDTNQKYFYCSLRSIENKKQFHLSVHRALWSCFNNDIEYGKEIDHIDNNTQNNKLSNLQCITVSENRKRRNHDFIKEIGKNAHANKRNIKGINIENNEIKIFKSKNSCAKYYGCSPSLVYYICEKKNYTKTYMKKYSFEYTNDEVDTIVKDARIGTKYNIKKKDKIIKEKKQVKTEDEKKIAHKEAMKRYQAKKKLLTLN